MGPHQRLSINARDRHLGVKIDSGIRAEGPLIEARAHERWQVRFGHILLYEVLRGYQEAVSIPIAAKGEPVRLPEANLGIAVQGFKVDLPLRRKPLHVDRADDSPQPLFQRS